MTPGASLESINNADRKSVRFFVQHKKFYAQNNNIK